MNIDMNTDEMLDAAYSAKTLSHDLHAAYWLRGRNDDTSAYLVRQSREAFLKLAEEMGYSVAPIDVATVTPPDPEEAAAPGAEAAE